MNHRQIGSTRSAIMVIPRVYFLKEDEQLLVEALTRRWTVNGPGSYVAAPLQRVKKRDALTLGPTDYVWLRDTLTGEVLVEYGPKQVFLSASQEVVDLLKAIPLKENQYVRILDNRTGRIRVERGEQS